MRYFHKKL